MEIEETTKYTYLGDVVTNDGKNTENIQSRKSKLMASTVTINTIATSEVLNKVETAVLLELHEKITIPGYLTNSEAWNLSKKDEEDLETLEIQSIKALFDLPIHTPTPALIYTFGTLYTRQRIDQKQLSFLHKILNRENTHWTKMTLEALENKNIGWNKNIKSILEKYDLPTDFHTVKNIPAPEWKRKTKISIEKENIKRLRQQCYKTTNGTTKIKTKTKTIIEATDEQAYKRQPRPEILNSTKQESKTMIIARFGMLECGRNYKGTMKEICSVCDTIDDENHRINYCKRWETVNYANCNDKKDFNLIFSNDMTVIRGILPVIENVWNTKNAHGTMNTN